MVSCYSSPNRLSDFEEMLHEIRMIVTREKNNIVLCGNFNAKSPLWSSKIEDARGKDLIETVNMFDLRLINKGSVATCVRPQGSSIVDITWSTSDIHSIICNWKVEDDDISLSDHRYITFAVNESEVAVDSANNYKRIAWSFKKFNADLFHSVFVWECPQIKVSEDADGGSSQELSEQLDGIMKRACDAAMPRQPQGSYQRKATY